MHCKKIPYLFMNKYYERNRSEISYYLRETQSTSSIRICLIYLKYYSLGSPQSLGRPRRRWEDNIKVDLREIGFGDVDWINWAQDRDRWRALVNTVTNLRVP
jgi:hypothetical protein